MSEAMKPRPDGFLSENAISHTSEVFDYITELHGILWKFVYTAIPGAGGNLNSYIFPALAALSSSQQEVAGLKAGVEEWKRGAKDNQAWCEQAIAGKKRAEKKVAGLKAAWTKVRTRIICTVDPVCAEHGFKEAMDAVKEMDDLASSQPVGEGKP